LPGQPALHTDHVCQPHLAEDAIALAQRLLQNAEEGPFSRGEESLRLLIRERLRGATARREEAEDTDHGGEDREDADQGEQRAEYVRHVLYVLSRSGMAA
jgi:hypothetical protein